MKNSYFYSTFFGSTPVSGNFIPQELQVKKALTKSQMEDLGNPQKEIAERPKIPSSFYKNWLGH